MARDDQKSSDAAAELMRLVNGYQISQALYVAVILGIADLLTDGPRTSTALAKATGTHASSLYRLLRALASIGVLKEEKNRRFRLTPMGSGLRSDAENSIAPWAQFIGQPATWAAWGELLYSIKTGRNTFRHVHGMDAWEYRKRYRRAGIVFDRAMSGNTRRTISLAGRYNFGKFSCIVDVGGGEGIFLAEILAHFPKVHGVLFDRPHVTRKAKQLFKKKRISGRCAVASGDFFVEVPEGGNLYILKHILNDWENAGAAAILRSCRRAMSSSATLLVITQLVEGPNKGPEAKFQDLHMLVSPGGRKRTREEYEILLSAEGFEVVRVIPTETGLSLIECVPC